MDAFGRPIDVFQCQTADFTYAKSIKREQENDRVISNDTRLIASRTRDQTLNRFPRRALWKQFVCVNAGPVNRFSDPWGTPRMGSRIREEGSQ